MTNLRGNFAPHAPGAPRPASSVSPPIGTPVFLVEIDARTGTLDYRSGYRTASDVEVGPDGRRFVEVLTDSQWRAWHQDRSDPGRAPRPAGRRFPAELVWWSAGNPGW